MAVSEAEKKRVADKAAAKEALKRNSSTDEGRKEEAATLSEVQGCLRLQRGEAMR